MKPIDTHLTFAAVAAVFALTALPAPALADFQIDQAGKDTHAPFDANNTDNELYLTTPVMPNLQYADTQSAEVNQRFKYSLKNLPDFMAPFAALPRGGCIKIGTANHDDGECAFYEVAAGEVCTLTDVNGDARQVGDFYSKFTREIDFSARDYYKFLYLDVQVYCSDY